MWIDVGIAVSTLIAASVFLWSVTAYQYVEFYKLVSPLHVSTILFYFNVFMIGIRLRDYILLSKIINFLFLLCIFGFIVAADLYYYFKKQSHESYKHENIYIVMTFVDASYGVILIFMNWFNYGSILIEDKHKLTRLIFLQIGYVVTTFSQVIPLYMAKQIQLTNDFVYLFLATLHSG